MRPFSHANSFVSIFAHLPFQRNFAELGGAYYCFSIFSNHLSCWIAASLYTSYMQHGPEIGASTIYAFLGALLALWLMSALLFFSKIKRSHWSTFYSTRTGRENTMSYFIENDDDMTKSKIFVDSIDLWRDIEGEVKEWTLSRWCEWEKEKPEWFTEGFKERVPDSMIPKSVLEELNRKSAGGKRRRSSVGLSSAA